MSPVILTCVVAACLIPQIRVGAVSTKPNSPTTTEPGTISPPVDLCQLPPYNISYLTRESFWFANVRTNLCFDPSATSCTFYFAFCQAVQKTNNTACQGAAVCLIGNYDNGTSIGYDMGRFTNTTQFNENKGTVTGGFYMDVANGSRNTWDIECVENSTGISTRIVLVCNSTVEWKSPNLTDFINVEYSEPCSFTITLPYAGACLPLAPTSSPTIPPSTTSTSSTRSHSIKPIVTASTKATSIPIPTTASTAAGGTTSVHPTPTVTPEPPTTKPEHPTTPGATTPEVTTHEKPTTGKPTRPPPKTTTPPPNNDRHLIDGLIAGNVIFALISVVLLVLLIFVARILFTKGGQYRRVSNNDDM